MAASVLTAFSKLLPAAGSSQPYQAPRPVQRPSALGGRRLTPSGLRQQPGTAPTTASPLLVSAPVARPCPMPGKTSGISIGAEHWFGVLPNASSPCRKRRAPPAAPTPWPTAPADVTISLRCFSREQASHALAPGSAYPPAPLSEHRHLCRPAPPELVEHVVQSVGALLSVQYQILPGDTSAAATRLAGFRWRWPIPPERAPGPVADC